jgi:putative transposase
MDWRWSSVHALLAPDRGDGLTVTGPVLSRYPGILAMIGAGEDEALSRSLRRAETIGRPIGAPEFLARLEAEAGRVLAPAKRGRKVKISALSP